MGPDDCAVDDEVFHVGVIDEILMHTLPYSAFTPAGEAFIDAVPITIFGWEHPPLRTGPRNPQYSINKLPTFGFLPRTSFITPTIVHSLQPWYKRDRTPPKSIT